MGARFSPFPIFRMITLAKNLYWYRVEKVLKLTGGNTFKAIIDLGVGTYKEVVIGLADIKCYKKSGRLSESFVEYCLSNEIPFPDKENRKRLALLAHQELAKKLKESNLIIIQSKKLAKQDSFGIMIADVYCDNLHINQYLVRKGLAVPYLDQP